MEQLRTQIEGAIEALISLLDELDGDLDLEPACEDEGFDADTEEDYRHHGGATYAEGDLDQLRIVTAVLDGQPITEQLNI